MFEYCLSCNKFRVLSVTTELCTECERAENTEEINIMYWLTRGMRFKKRAVA